MPTTTGNSVQRGHKSRFGMEQDNEDTGLVQLSANVFGIRQFIRQLIGSSNEIGGVNVHVDVVPIQKPVQAASKHSASGKHKNQSFHSEKLRTTAVAAAVMGFLTALLARWYGVRACCHLAGASHPPLRHATLGQVASEAAEKWGHRTAAHFPVENVSLGYAEFHEQNVSILTGGRPLGCWLRLTGA
ncbi:hypothetical protein MRX96_010966 [Rhipicephalus microplus]